MSTETQVAETYIYSTLATELSGTELSGCPIWPDVADPGTAWPCIVFNLQSPRGDQMVVGDDRILSVLLYQIKAIGITRKEDLDAYAAAIDAALHGYVGTANGVLGIVRENPIAYTEVSGSEKYYHLGGLYQLHVQPTQVLTLRFTNGTAPYTALLGTKFNSSQSGRLVRWDSSVGGEVNPAPGTWSGVIPDGTYAASVVDAPTSLKTWSGNIVVRKNKLTPSTVTLT